MYEQEIRELVMEWIMLYQNFPGKEMPLTIIDYIKLRSQDGTVKFIKDKDWKILKEQRTKLSAVGAKLESIEEDFK